MPVWNQICLQDTSSASMFLISSFHDHVMLIVILIVCTVLYIIMATVSNKLLNRFFHKNEMLELIWTVVPGLLIVSLAMPSLYSLYMMEEMFDPTITFKAIGHQWYWTYEFSDFKNVSFDSYLVSECEKDGFRLLDVDLNLVVPFNVGIRLVTTSTDVIHSWTIPSLGVKVDSIPGRLNQSYFVPIKMGVLYGQCSEICGSLHSFMPICMEIVNNKTFMSWIKSFL